MKKFHFSIDFLIVFLGLMLFSCKSAKVVEPKLSPVYVTNAKKVGLLPPSALEKPLDKVQLLTGAFGDRTFSFVTYITGNEEGLDIVLLNEIGTDVGSLSYDGKSVRMESPFIPENLKAEYIFCDIQNAYYDVESLKENYAAVGLSFDVENQADRQVRRVMDGKRVVEEIIITDRVVKIENKLRGYMYILTEAE